MLALTKDIPKNLFREISIVTMQSSIKSENDTTTFVCMVITPAEVK